MSSRHSIDTSHPQIAVIAPEISRKNPEGAFMRFLRDNESILRRRFTIIATAGTFDTIMQTGYFQKEKHIIPLLAGGRGGIVEVAYRVVTGQCGVLIFLYDPEEVRSESPETRALTRVCIHKQITLLITVETADQWIKYRAEGYKPPTPVDWLKGKEGHGGSYRELGPERSTVALIAHDAKKKDMRAFVTDPDISKFLKRFHRILATGTTGTLIKGWCHNEHGAPVADKVVLANSGPEGGDVQIAHEILTGRCQVVIFLHDPLTAHPHDPDISLLRRTCQLPGVKTILLSDLLAARDWVETASGSPEPPPLGERLRSQLWNKDKKTKLKEVLVVPEDMVKEPIQMQKNIFSEAQGWGRNTDQWAHHKTEWEKVVSELAKVASYYIDAILRQESGQETVIAVNWGPTMDILADAIQQLKPAPIKNLVVIPMTGIPGVIYDRYNPNDVALRIARAFEGKFKEIGAPMFVATDEDPLNPDQKETLSRSRVVLTSIGPIPRDQWFSQEVTFAQDNNVWDRVALEAIKKGSTGVIGPILIDEQGNRVDIAYKPVGLQHSDLQTIAKEGRVIAIVGGDERRYAAIWAALQAGLCSVLITEPETAENLLRLSKVVTSAKNG